MPVFDYKLTPDGDLELDNIGKPIVILEDDIILQQATQHLKLWRGSWVFNIGYGTDWHGVLQKNVNQNIIGQIITQSLLQLDFVDSVIDVFVSPNRKTRQAEITIFFRANGRDFTLEETL